MAVELAAAYISLLPDTSKIAPGVKLALARTDGDIVILPDLTRFSTTLKTGTERAAVTAGKSSGSKFSQAFQALTRGVTDLDAGLLLGDVGWQDDGVQVRCRLRSGDARPG